MSVPRSDGSVEQSWELQFLFEGKFRIKPLQFLRINIRKFRAKEQSAREQGQADVSPTHKPSAREKKSHLQRQCRMQQPPENQNDGNISDRL